MQLSRHRVLRFCLVATILLTGAILLSSAPETKRISIYSPSANYSLPVIAHNGDYVDLLEILAPLGAVSARSDGRTWKVHYNYLDGEFDNGSTRARVQGQTFDLPGSFVLDNGRGLVPLGSLVTCCRAFWARRWNSTKLLAACLSAVSRFTLPPRSTRQLRRRW